MTNSIMANVEYVGKLRMSLRPFRIIEDHPCLILDWNDSDCLAVRLDPDKIQYPDSGPLDHANYQESVTPDSHQPFVHTVDGLDLS